MGSDIDTLLAVYTGVAAIVGAFLAGLALAESTGRRVSDLAHGVTELLVPYPAAASSRYSSVPEVNYVDREVFAKLRRLNIVPSDLASDAEFLRRVTIDAIGSLPSPDTIPGAFIRNVEGRIAELEADESAAAIAEAAELRDVLRLGRLLLAGHEVTL